jgi:hypothetical protein
MVVQWRHQGDAVTKPDAFGPLRARSQKHLGGRRVRILLEEMMFDLPDVV